MEVSLMAIPSTIFLSLKTTPLPRYYCGFLGKFH
jgi:hypothetical protein